MMILRDFLEYAASRADTFMDPEKSRCFRALPEAEQILRHHDGEAVTKPKSQSVEGKGIERPMRAPNYLLFLSGRTMTRIVANTSPVLLIAGEGNDNTCGRRICRKLSSTIGWAAFSRA